MGLLKQLRELFIPHNFTIDDKFYVGDMLGNIIEERSSKGSKALLIRRYMITHRNKIDESVKLTDFLKEAKYSVMEVSSLNKKDTVVFSILRNEDPNIDIIAALRTDIDTIANILDERLGDNFEASSIGCGLIKVTKLNKGRN